MDFGLHGGRHAYRPYAASLPVRVPTVKGLFPASFGLAARLAPHDFRSAVPYGYLHRSRQDRFILRESAHAGHTGSRFLACRVATLGDISSNPLPSASGNKFAPDEITITDSREAATEYSPGWSR